MSGRRRGNNWRQRRPESRSGKGTAPLSERAALTNRYCFSGEAYDDLLAAYESLRQLNDSIGPSDNYAAGLSQTCSLGEMVADPAETDTVSLSMMVVDQIQTLRQRFRIIEFDRDAYKRFIQTLAEDYDIDPMDIPRILRTKRKG